MLRAHTFLLPAALIVIGGFVACGPAPADLARRGDVVDVINGVEVADPYRWLEDHDSEETKTWTEARTAEFKAASESLPQYQKLYDRYQHLLRYDDEGVPQPCLLSNRLIVRTKKAEDDKWVVNMREGADGELKMLLDPNTWDQTETLAGFYASPDCRWAAYGKAKAGDENPVITVMNLDTLELLPDTLQGWRQFGASWLHDSSGFYYTSQPLAGEVPEGEEFYWSRTWFHTRGTQAEDDSLVFSDDKVKELFHYVYASEDGRWLLMGKSRFNTNSFWLKDLASDDQPVPVVTGLDWEYRPQVVGDQLVIVTDWQAPNFRVMIASVEQPDRDHWQELIPESADRLSWIAAVGGKLYTMYQHNAATRIAVYQLDGTYLHDIELPTMGSAYVWGYWSRPEVWLSFSSFAHPTTVYNYDPESRQLSLYHESPLDIDPSGIVVEQVWYPSKDGTEISMFLVHHRDAPVDGSVPYQLTGYGGFDISMTPGFSATKAVWIEAGGGVAIPNLRGGGEYGRQWHEAGMRKNKQNVFDDFLAAADWLVDNGYTARDRLAIAGGSNGGLLVSAVITQRPDLCAAVLCGSPLTDMVRFHKLGLANIWAEEYGSTDDPEMTEYLLGYSPYHQVRQGANYPAMLIIGSDNDARTDPAHASKFAAAALWADADNGRQQPIYLSMQIKSGHGGAAAFDQRVDQIARSHAFLMDQLGMSVP